MVIPEFDFTSKVPYGLFIAAGGFDKRALTFIRRAYVRKFNIEQAILLRYVTQREDNEPNFNRLMTRVKKFTNNVEIIDVDVHKPDKILKELAEKVHFASKSLNSLSAVIDISGMAHVLICCCLRAADNNLLQTSVVYTEASDYYPREAKWDVVIDAVQKRNFKIMAKYLQTAGLGDIQIPTDFKGNTRPGYKACLFVMTGYEPNRVQGLVDDYAPNAIVAFYGKSPHEKLHGRQDLSIDLHKHIFDGWRYRERYDISTLEVKNILNILENEYQTLRSEYDVGVTSQCSKMQTVASYIFWKQHPEVQLIFTTPVKWSKRHSMGEGHTFQFNL
jgi:hypothetical protein